MYETFPFVYYRGMTRHLPHFRSRHEPIRPACLAPFCRRRRCSMCIDAACAATGAGADDARASRRQPPPAGACGSFCRRCHRRRCHRPQRRLPLRWCLPHPIRIFLARPQRRGKFQDNTSDSVQLHQDRLFGPVPLGLCHSPVRCLHRSRGLSHAARKSRLLPRLRVHCGRRREGLLGRLSCL